MSLQKIDGTVITHYSLDENFMGLITYSKLVIATLQRIQLVLIHHMAVSC